MNSSEPFPSRRYGLRNTHDNTLERLFFTGLRSLLLELYVSYFLLCFAKTNHVQSTFRFVTYCVLCDVLCVITQNKPSLGTMILLGVAAMSHRDLLCYKRALCPIDE